jgi:hypothetical protein
MRYAPSYGASNFGYRRASALVNGTGSLIDLPAVHHSGCSP